MKVISKIPPWMLLCLFCLSISTETASSAALPDIAEYFGVEGGVVQVSSCAYFLGISCGIFSLGRISDIFGRRTVVLYGISCYIIATLFIVSIENVRWLIALRFFQAFGASVGSVVAQAMARDSYKGHELSYIYATLSMAIAFMPALSSTISGYLVEFHNWRLVFLALSLAASGLLVIYVKFLPETNPYIGLAQQTRFLSVLRVVLKDRLVLLYAVIIGLYNGMTFGFYLEAPFIFHRIGISPASYGKLILLLTLASAISGGVNRRLIRKQHIDGKQIMAAGLKLSLAGCLIFLVSSMFIQKDTGKAMAVILIFGPMMLHMLGHNMVMPMVLRYALEDYSKVTGTAGSIFGSMYYFLVACISFSISKIHSDSVPNFALLFFILSLLCSISFYLIQRISSSENRTNEFSSL